MGDNIRLWAVFERAEQRISKHIIPDQHSHQVPEDHPDLQRAFELLGLHWRISSG
ncbi:hypothetical protein ACPW96_23060 [Micromonospora sp. DT81.3]|uniref:hypothetical protein n=1 Tax=Micromonospora sp. DT81.3 TaxID=3416523 RepID=UPI003CF23147